MKIKTLIIAVAAFALMATTIAWQAERIAELKVDHRQAVDFIRKDSIELHYYKNKLNNEVAKAQQLSLSLTNARELISTERLAWINQFEGINKRLNNLESATKTTARLVASFEIPLRDTTIIQPDSTLLRARTFDNKNKWIGLKGIILPDTVQIEPQVLVPIEEVQYWQRKKFLFLRIGRKQYFSDISSPNPYVKFTQHEVFRIGKKK